MQQEVLRRINAREWPPGALIPNEADLATEFGCARATVNRALRTVAEAGFLDRKRRAGTRVALQPVARATLSIAVIRQEVEDNGTAAEAQDLGCAAGDALFVLTRNTWNDTTAVTRVRLLFAQGYEMQADL